MVPRALRPTWSGGRRGRRDEDAAPHVVPGDAPHLRRPVRLRWRVAREAAGHLRPLHNRGHHALRAPSQRSVQRGRADHGGRPAAARQGAPDPGPEVLISAGSLTGRLRSPIFRWAAQKNLLVSALVARPDLVAGPVFKTGGAYGDVGSASSILVRYRHKNLMVGWMVCR